MRAISCKGRANWNTRDLLSQTLFDKKFGEACLSQVPTAPGVYRYLDARGVVLYVGKAKNLRRRLASYRNAGTRRTQRKLRRIVKAAHSLSYEVCESETAALLREGELIRELAPKYNVDGAFAFLYPYLGVGAWDKHTLLCFTTDPDAFSALGLTWFGCFRSRPRVKAAFDALIELLSLLGHREKTTRLPAFPRLRGSRLVGMRQLPSSVSTLIAPLFSGESSSLPSEVALRLLDKPRALKDPILVQQHLHALRHFFEADAKRLRGALQRTKRTGTTVSQAERDALFILAEERVALPVDDKEERSALLVDAPCCC